MRYAPPYSTSIANREFSLSNKVEDVVHVRLVYTHYNVQIAQLHKVKPSGLKAHLECSSAYEKVKPLIIIVHLTATEYYFSISSNLDRIAAQQRKHYLQDTAVCINLDLAIILLGNVRNLRKHS